ncbi:MAG: hypothetical protein IIB78_00615 [Proteobacteria bacterium]|nr:hypothetical protein [Pseudomonadota bacterium]
MKKDNWFTIYLLPGFVFQSLVIAGGYATGRELVEFFLRLGPLTGLLGMLVTTLVWSVVAAISFEFARMTKSYDYRAFFQELLGKAWFLYEIAYVAMLLLVLSVIAAAGGDMMENSFGIPRATSTVMIMGAIGLLTFFGTTVIEKFLSYWSLLLYGVYILFLAWGVSQFGGDISRNFSQSSIDSGWFTGGVSYAGYNLAVIPAVLFCISHISKRKQALASGAIAGVIGILPGVLFFIVMVGMYPAIIDSSIPSSTILAAYDARWFEVLFQIVIFGTFIETGSGLLHSLNERVFHTAQERGRTLPAYLRPVIAVSVLILAIIAGGKLGLVALIAQGYGFMTWVFIGVFVVPVLTIGLARILRSNNVE